MAGWFAGLRHEGAPVEQDSDRRLAWTFEVFDLAEQIIKEKEAGVTARLPAVDRSEHYQKQRRPHARSGGCQGALAAAPGGVVGGSCRCLDARLVETGIVGGADRVF